VSLWAVCCCCCCCCDGSLCPHHAGPAAGDERAAVALQLGGAEGLVDVLDGVGAHHGFAPEEEESGVMSHEL